MSLEVTRELLQLALYFVMLTFYRAHSFLVGDGALEWASKRHLSTATTSTEAKEVDIPPLLEVRV